MNINGIAEVIFDLMNIEQNVVEVELAFKEHHCNFDKWSRAVFNVEGNDDTAPIPPFEIRQEIPDRMKFMDGYFWTLEDAQTNIEYYYEYDDGMVITNYAGNVCWRESDLWKDDDDAES